VSDRNVVSPTLEASRVLTSQRHGTGVQLGLHGIQIVRATVLAQSVLGRIRQPSQVRLHGTLAVKSSLRKLPLTHLLHSLYLSVDALLVHTARKTEACRWTRCDEQWVLESGVADGIDRGAVDLVVNTSASNDASAVLPASIGRRG
jgi:hypothetical protein